MNNLQKLIFSLLFASFSFYIICQRDEKKRLKSCKHGPSIESSPDLKGGKSSVEKETQKCIKSFEINII